MEGFSPDLLLLGSAASIHDQSRMQLMSSHLPLLLHYEDRGSMAYSVEARVPFLDHRVVELHLALPDDLKIRDGETKAVLREAMRGVLPEVVRSRQDKMGFVTPESVWASGEVAGSFRAAIATACARAPQILDERAVMAAFQLMAEGKQPYQGWVWRAITLGAWVERFDVGLA
jgi:asparagine synthase (glutamine-hydrolysing)